MERHFSALYPADTRFDEIKKVLGFVQAGNASQVLGIPGVGRTVFFGLLAFNKKVKELHLGERARRYHFVLVDFTALKDESLAEVGKTMLLAIFQSLKDRELLEEAAFVENIFRENNTSSDSTQLFFGVHKAIDYLAHEKDLSVVLLLDSIEAYAPHLDPRFFTHMTALRDHMRYKLSLIFSLNRPLESLVDGEYAGQVNQLIAGHSLWLSLSDTVSNGFVRDFLSKQFEKAIDDILYEEVIKITGGHAKFVKVALEESLQNAIAASDFLAFIKENRALRSVCYEIWNSLHADEQIFLKNLSRHSEAQLKNPEEILRVAQDDNEGAYLKNAHLLTADKAFTISLFRDFVADKAEHLQQSTFSYREDTNDLLKGDTIISENFTATEFRLLIHLLRHKDQVVERDALIAAAWKDAKSTAGVSEQALDQLLHRVRKKIEEDPNNPAHLLTIKGRGVKFIP